MPASNNRSRRTMRSRAMPRVAAAVALSAGLVALTPQMAQAAPAEPARPAATPTTQADDQGLLVSTDGIHFGATAAEALFPEGIVMTPAATHSANLYLKNPTTTDAVFSISLADISASAPDFAAALAVSAQVDDDAPFAPVTLDAAECRTLASGSLPAGGTVKNLLELAMADVAGVQAQGEQARFALRVRVRDATAPAAASPCNTGALVPAFHSSSGPGNRVSATLASTGAHVGIAALFALALIGAGTLVVESSRRRRKVLP